MTDKATHESIADRLKDFGGVQRALQRAARQAVLEHARAGLKIVVWRDNQVVWEDAKVEEEPESGPPVS